MARTSPTLLGSACALGLLCLLLGACRTDGPDTTTDTSSTDTTMAAGDTTAADTSAQPIGPNDPAPAPGTARVRAEIVSCDAEAAPVRCQVRIEEVLGYGSATPTLSTGTHTVALDASLLKNRDAAALETLGPRTLVVHHAGDRPALGEQSDRDRPAWTVQSIER